MSLIIKYMEMPQNCNECRFCVEKEVDYDSSDWSGNMCLALDRKWDEDKAVDYYEDEDGDWIDFDIKSGRHPDCPLRERKGNKEEEE